ncbi:MAG: GNAT family N-acetyltransferase [Candidatus Kariarchaeaceae archaeon]|jgi:diamine N-acetyltransferase
MSISIREITAENWIEAIKLKVKEEQENFVASNAVSIAQSKFDTYLDCHGIYNEDKMVGFAATGKNPDDGEIWIARHMIGAQFQGQGYGKFGLQELIETLKTKWDCENIFLTVEPENTGARALYEKSGFQDTGRIMGQKGLVLELKL